MSRDIKAILHIKKYNELFNLFMIAIIIAAMLIMCLVFSTNTSFDTEGLSMILAGGIIGGYVGTSMFFKIFFIADEVPRGLTFGMTRKKLFVGCRIVDMLEILFFTLVAFAFIKVIGVSMILKVAVALYGVYMWVEGLAGNSVVRYGKIAYWVYYFVFLFAVIALPRLGYFIPSFGTPLALAWDFFINPFFNQGIVWTSILVFDLLGLIVNWLTFRKIPVNYAS
ncbi:hypothetical protein NXH64_05585 [Butyrivibrio fibrisolvens]|uniref:hypothetical protein n=1 Tax=Pseudobutyrivibrio ruminis TaxID=46206 RepID=UPI000484E8EE|nr:hypothetical protein [Pseudobutyrivibrio ruminis]MDC7278975.1 hypothetical protein [Butyrivibrio fibrisolvens]